MSSIHRIRLARVLIILGIAALGLAGRSALAAPAQQSMTIEMQDFQFAPKTVTIVAGTTVNWSNPGAAPHTTTSEAGLWDSGQKAPGESFSFTFTQAGTFAYYCTLHGARGGVGMAGTIIVTAAQAAPAPTATKAPAPAAPTATKAPAAAQPAATKAPAGAAPAATATTAPAAGGSADTPPNLPTTGQGDMNMLLLGIAIIALGTGTILNRSARRRSNSR
jgi:LPXTG-motif cell wall-anchored protein